MSTQVEPCPICHAPEMYRSGRAIYCMTCNLFLEGKEGSTFEDNLAIWNSMERKPAVGVTEKVHYDVEGFEDGAWLALGAEWTLPECRANVASAAAEGLPARQIIEVTTKVTRKAVY
jgi:hypothetical protein